MKISERHFSSIQRGFTLIELLIVIVIVSILGAIAYPSYMSSVAKSKRAEARAQLMETAQYMQRFYSQNDRYNQTNEATPVATTIPSALAMVPKEAVAGKQNYNISFVANTLTATGFQLQAVPVNGMSTDICGTLQLDQVGRRTVSGATSPQTAQTCWK